MGKRTAKSRSAFRIQLTGSAKSQLDDMTDRIGMSQIDVTSRLTEWFTKQPQTLQAAILGLYPKAIEPDVAQLILKRLAAKK